MRRQSLGFKPSVAIASISDWMRKAARSGQPITPHQVEAWAAAFDTAERRAREIEAASLAGAAVRQAKEFEAHAQRLALQAIQEAFVQVADIARDAATRNELVMIDETTGAVGRALALIADGFDGPSSIPHPRGDNHGA